MPGVNPFVPNLPTPTPLTPEQIKAGALRTACMQIEADGRRLLQQAVESITKGWSGVWESTQYAPAEILAALGPKAVEVFRCTMIFTAAIDAIQKGLPGTPQPVLLDAKYLSAPVAYTVNDDGTVTLNS
jgi:hypothetical protein